jgi:hypothetical protein
MIGWNSEPAARDRAFHFAAPSFLDSFGQREFRQNHPRRRGGHGTHCITIHVCSCYFVSHLEMCSFLHGSTFPQCLRYRLGFVVRENDIAGEEPKNQQHPDRLSLMGSYQYKACNIVTGALEKTLKNQTDFSVGTITLVGGRAKTSRSEYGCSLHAQRGDSVCRNGLRIQRQQLEDRLLSGLQDKVLREEFVEYVICGLQEELRQRHENLEAGLERLRDEKRRIEVELKRLVDTIAVGNSSATVMDAINEREARLRQIANQVIEPGSESLQEKLEELRTFAVLRLTRLRELLTNPAAIHEARALLADQIGKFKLERVNENGRISFKANGNIDFFGEEALTRVGGAGGQNRTGYARLFRAALYQ